MCRIVVVFLVAGAAALAVSGAAGLAQPKPPPVEYYTVKIIEVLSSKKIERNNPKGGDLLELIVKLDKKIPTDTGRIEIGGDSAATPAKDGKAAPGVDTKESRAPATVFNMAFYQPDPKTRLTESDQIIVYFDADKAAKGTFKTVDDLKKLLPIAAKVHLRNHRP